MTSSYAKANTSISQGSVGWHLAHSLLTINGIIEALRKSDPKQYVWKFNLTRSYVFTTGKIPRGKGKAPSVVHPKSEDLATIQHLLELSKERLLVLENIPSNQYFHHPYFGHMRKKKTIQFLVLHTRHHLQIMQEIALDRNKKHAID